MINIYLNGTIKCVAPTELNIVYGLFFYNGIAPTEHKLGII